MQRGTFEKKPAHTRSQSQGPRMVKLAGGLRIGRPDKYSLSVAVALEVEEELENAPLEDAFEAALASELPLAIDDLEGNVLVGQTRGEAQDAEVLRVRRFEDVPGRLG